MKKTVFCNREFYLLRTKHIPDREQQSMILSSRWLLLKILVISTWLGVWFGVWLVNCIWFTWIIAGNFILTELLAYIFFVEDVSPSLIFVIQKHPNFWQFLPGKFQSSSGDICTLRDLLGAIGRIKMYALLLLLFRIHLLVSLVLLIFIIIVILNSIFCPTQQKEKRLRYLWCGNNLLNHYTFFLNKQSIFDPRPENCLSFSKKSL